MIGKQYLLASMFFGAVSGLLAMCVRWQLGFPGQPLPVLGHLLALVPGQIHRHAGRSDPAGDI